MKEILKTSGDSSSRISIYSKNSNIIELKSLKGNARLFAFFLQDKKSIIVCTNCYWKKTDKKVKQNQAFDKALKLMNLYLQQRN